MRGKVLLLGTGIRVMTFFHTFDDLLEPRMPFSPFAPGTFDLRSRHDDGTIVETRTRLFDPALSRRRDLDKLVPVLHSRGVWREGRVGHLDAVALAAVDVEAAVLELAGDGVYCYEPA